jgi:hypothetical protein
MYWIVLAHDCVGSHATLIEGKPPREGMDEGGTVELRLLGATEDLRAAIAAVESLESRLRDQRRAGSRRVPSVLTVAKERGAF